jgi:hypothetical protein
MTLKDIKKQLDIAIDKFGEDMEVEFMDHDMNEYIVTLDGELITPDIEDNIEEEDNDFGIIAEPVLRCYVK